jgi:hypothetical protein
MWYEEPTLRRTFGDCRSCRVDRVSTVNGLKSRPPVTRGRDVFGSGANYGKALLDLPRRDIRARAPECETGARRLRFLCVPLQKNQNAGARALDKRPRRPTETVSNSLATSEFDSPADGGRRTVFG